VLGTASGAVLVDEHRRRVRVLDDDADLVRELIQRRNRYPVDGFTVAPSRQNADAPAQAGGGERRIERGTAKHGRAVREEIGANVADDQVFGRASRLHPRERAAVAQGLSR
jgi:hypothetical protein